MVRRGNQAERNAPVGWIPTVTPFSRNDTGEIPTPERTLIQGVFIHAVCNFKDGTRAATAARKRAPSLTKKYKRLRRVVAKLAHKAQ